MFQRLFDSPAQLLILLVIILLLFGASRLPNTARQLGRSMRIFKSEMKEMKTENPKPERAEDEPDDEDGRASRIEALEGRVVDDRPSGTAQASGPTGATRSSDVDRDR
ncbi:MAG: Sec-independent protein translocase subunit TatA [Kineosporiaceae bacterium]